MGRLVRRVLNGNTTLIEWSPEDPITVEAAREVMRREIANGYMAVREDADGSVPVRQLPADAELVILTMPLGGG
jgi:hypothetical protein